VLNLDLWRFYISYVRETKSSKPEFRAILTKTYSFATEHIGHDPHSSQIWRDYIAFLKIGEASSSYEEEQKVVSIRKVYHAACSQPLIDVEPIWRDYIDFEEGVNKTLAGKLVEERKSKFLLAKKCGKEYEHLSRLLVRIEPALPPKGTARELQQKQRWEQYIAWEKSNPMQYTDISRLTKRVHFAYRQCLLHFVRHPDVWYEAALYLEKMGMSELEKQRDSEIGKSLVQEARDVYDTVTSTFLPESLLLHFAFADFEEGQGCNDKAEEVYENLLKNEAIDPSLVRCVCL
jgi:cleavage stimulation factor subunit 3